MNIIYLPRNQPRNQTGANSVSSAETRPSGAPGSRLWTHPTTPNSALDASSRVREASKARQQEAFIQPRRERKSMEGKKPGTMKV
jgi:hypothetical protein